MPTSNETMDVVPEMETQKILLVEDDRKLARLTRDYLEGNNFEVAWEERGDVVAERVADDPPDLILLDIMLPGLDGRSVCRDLRPEYAGPILMLTALGDEVDEVLGLEIGADDYLTKPVSPRLLLSRIQALLRRFARAREARPVPQDDNDGIVVIGSIRVDHGNRVVSVANRDIELTTAEFDLLSYLVRNPGEVLSRDRIYNAVRGIDYDGLDRSIDIRIARLRKKLGDDGKQPRYIKSIRGEGYLMVRDP